MQRKAERKGMLYNSYIATRSVRRFENVTRYLKINGVRNSRNKTVSGKPSERVV